MKKRSTLWTDRLLATIFVILVLYLSYRYPLQINFSGSSPTYSDTPLPLQLGKFLIALAGLLIISTKGSLLRINTSSGVWAAVFLIAISTALLKFLASEDIGFLEPYTWCAFGFLYAAGTPRVSARTAEKFIVFLFSYSLLVQFVQVLLFATVGRLPALAYADSYSVRFGSFLDDPNGFAALAFLFLGYFFAHEQPRTRWLGVFVSCLLILLTQSLTAIGFLIILIGLYALKGNMRSKIFFSIFVLILGGYAVYVIETTDILDILTQMYTQKSQSISDHSPQAAIEHALDGPLTFLFGSDEYFFTESWFAQSLANFGLAGLFVWLFFFLHVATRLKRDFASCHRKASKTYSAIAFFVAYFIFACLNLPMLNVYPINFLFFFLTFSILMQRISWNPAYQISPRTRHKI